MILGWYTYLIPTVYIHISGLLLSSLLEIVSECRVKGCRKLRQGSVGFCGFLLAHIQ
jgi:hypothetical protein